MKKSFIALICAIVSIGASAQEKFTVNAGFLFPSTLNATVGAVERKFFLGIEGGFEYNYVFQNGWEFSLIQKNNVNFLHGDTFRNGLLIGLKIPL